MNNKTIFNVIDQFTSITPYEFGDSYYSREDVEKMMVEILELQVTLSSKEGHEFIFGEEAQWMENEFFKNSKRIELFHI